MPEIELFGKRLSLEMLDAFLTLCRPDRSREDCFSLFFYNCSTLPNASPFFFATLN